MECCFVHEYIKQTVRNPEYSEPKWFAVASGTVTLDFPRAKLLYIHTLLIPVIDGGATGIDMFFSINGTVVVRWGTGVGLQSDVQIIPINHFIQTQRALISLNDTTISDFSFQLTVITEKKDC